MAIVIKFDVANNPLPARLILATKSGSRIRELPIEDVTFRDGLMDGSEFTCVVDKQRCVNTAGEVDESFWRRIVDFKLAYCPEYDQWYEIYVNINDSTDTKKSIQARSLGEAELSQINVYGIEVNTEDDIARDDYEPTVIYNSEDEKTSLIDRLLNKAPHYRIKHVDESIARIQRTFNFDGKSIYDCFSDVSQEVDCIFVLEANKTNEARVDRTVSVYDLENSCMVCGTRGDFTEACPACGSTAIKPGYGDDTTIFVAKENLADEISYDTDSDSVKNCFRLEAGDDLMTASIINCNPNGSQYIWYISDTMKEDMSDELRDKLDDYDALYEYYQNEYEFTPNANLRSQYNQIVTKYRAFKPELNTIPEIITGFANVMTAYYDTIDLQLFLNNELMPTVAVETTTAALEAAKLDAVALSPTAVANLSSCTESIAASAVLGVAKCLVRANYQVKVNESSYNSANHLWTGNFTVTNYADEEDTATSASAQVFINGDIEDYITQKLRKAMSQKSDNVTDISDLFALSLNSFKAELRKYSLQRLIAFREACQLSLDILIQQGVADSTNWTEMMRGLYDDIYLPYRDKMGAIEDEILLRTQEIAVVSGVYDENGGLLVNGVQSDLLSARKAVQNALNFEAYLGTTLWNEFASFRREDTFSNSNYISDGLNNEEIFLRAEEFLDVARKEIYKSATLQHSISASMLNLLSTVEFRPLVHNFKVGNWIRVQIDGEIYRLRLTEYTIDYDTWDLNVTFSDVKQGYSSANDLESLVSSMRSMSTSYGAIARQARAGKDGNDLLNHWAAEGFSLTTKIVGGAENQEFIIDQSGITGREYVPETFGYKDTQIKIISDGLYVTDDGWLTAKAGIGRFQFYNPQTQQIEEAYGVIADTIVGSIVLSEEVGIYNEGGSITLDEDGFTLIADANNNSTVFRIRKRLGDGTLVDILNLDSNGNLVLQSYSTTDEIATEYLSKEQAAADYAAKANTITDVYVEYIVADSPSVEPDEDDEDWSTETPVWEEGKYIWQRTVTINGNGMANYSNPTCIQGAAGSDGVPGTPGSDGLNNAVVYLYKRSSSAPTIDWSAILTYNFTNKALTSTPSGWSQTIPSGADPLYVTAATASSSTSTDTIAYTEWATPVILAQNGANGTNGTNGTNGLNNAIVYLYKRSSSAATVNWTNVLTYNFANKALTSTPTGWSQTIPSGTDPIYVTAATASSSESTDTIAYTEWSTPVILAQNGANGTNGTNGTNGEDGLNSATIYLYKRSTSAATINWSNALTYTFATGLLSSVPTGWYQAIPSGTDPIYVTTATAVSSDATDTIAYTEWATPSLMAQNGTNGENGLNTAIVYLYKRSASAATVNWTSALTYNFTNKALTSTPSGWSQTIPSGTDPLYVTAATASSTTNTDTIAYTEWSSPVVLTQNGSDGAPGTNGTNGTNGENGLNSATVYLYKRSSTAATINWSNALTYTFSTGKLTSAPTGWSQTIPSGTDPIYMTQATAVATTATDSIPYTEWSTPVILAQNGEDGAPGTNGLNNAIVYLYKRSTSAATVNWTTQLTYNFTNKALTSTPSGWSQTIPSGTNPLYVTAATASAATNTDTIAYTEWSTPVVLAQNGTDGAPGTNGSNGTNGTDGLNSATVYLFKRSSTAATIGWSNTLTYTFSTGKLTSTPSGWSQTIPSGTDPIYMTQATAVATTATDTIAYTEWATPVVLAQNGEDGEPGAAGLNSAVVYLYKRSSSAATVNWTSTLTYNFTNKALTSTPSGWSQTIPSGTDPLYVTAATASANTNTDTIAYTEWSTPVILAQNGANGQAGSAGAAGLNSATVYLFKRSATAATINWTSTLTYTFSTGKLSSTPNGWSQSVPTTGTDPIYVTTATAVATTATDTIAYTEWATPAILAQNGEDGDPGDPGLNSATVFLYKRPAVTTDTATGALVALTDHAPGQPLEDLVVDVVPVQSGTGAPTPTNVREITGYEKIVVGVTGKNILNPVPWVSQTASSGITSIPDGAGGISYSGSAVASKNRVIHDYYTHPYHLKAGVTYYGSSNNNCGITPSNSTFRMIVRDVSTGTTIFNEVDASSYTPTKDTDIYVGINYVNGFTFPENFKVYPVITASPDTSFEPFVGNDKIEYAVSETYAPKAYHAQLNLTNGQLVFTSFSVTLNGADSENWVYNSSYNGFYIASPSSLLKRCVSDGLLLCNIATVGTRSGWGNIPTPWGIYLDSQLCFRVDTSVTGTTVDSFKAWLAENPLQLVYKITPGVAQQSNQRDIATVNGPTYIWSEAGNVTVEYKKDPTSGVAAPSSALTYTFSNGTLTPAAALNGWSTTIPDTNGNPCYAIQATAISTSSTDTIEATEWSAPIILAQDGANGAVGDAGRGVKQLTDLYILHTSNTSAPTTPDNGGTGWVTTCPEWESGKFIWTCVKVTWDDGGTTYTTPTLAQALNDAAQKAYENEQALATFLITYAGDKSSLQSQIDGKIETFYQPTDPSTNWTSAQMATHEGDLWYNTATNENMRWNGNGWIELEVDVPVGVYDTLDRKAQIFTSEPVAPYHVGDLWFKSENDEIFTCLTARDKVDNFTITSTQTYQSFIYAHSWLLNNGQTYRVIGSGNVTTQATGGAINIDAVITFTSNLSSTNISIPFTEAHTYGSANAISNIEITQSGVLITYTASGTAERMLNLSFAFIETYEESDWVKYNKYTDDSLASEIEERLNNDYITAVEVGVDINNAVGALRTYVEESINGINTKVTEIKQTADDVTIRVDSMYDERTGEMIVDHVKTSTGYTFDSNGLSIRKSNEEIENLLNNQGMYVKRYSGGTVENVLTADANGVNALNLTTRRFLIIGSNSRFQDYSNGTDDKRTACYYIGG